jgi:LmbE family N-acetylglucosaminyl deacetylase
MVVAGDAAWRAMRLSARRASPAWLESTGGWLVLAPHPDDETLGAATLIATLAEVDRPAWVVFLTDGSASHVNAPDWPPCRIGRTRAREARFALRALGAPENRVVELGWPDSRPHPPGSAAFERSLTRLAGLCRREGIRAVASTWRHEPHCDHQAAFEMANALCLRSHRRIAVFEYLVWGWTDPDAPFRARGSQRWALDNPGAGRRGRHAITRHRTQLSPVIQGAEAAFRLPPEIVGLAGRPALLLRERRRHAS